MKHIINQIYEGYQPNKNTLNPKDPPKNCSLKPISTNASQSVHEEKK